MSDSLQLLLFYQINTENIVSFTSTQKRKPYSSIYKFLLTKISYYLFGRLKAYRLSELNFFVYIKSCKYSMFYTNKMF